MVVVYNGAFGLMSRVTFQLNLGVGKNLKERWHLVASIHYSKHQQSNFPTVASKISTIRSNVQIRLEARTVLKYFPGYHKISSNPFIDLWTYCRSLLDIPSYRLYNKFVVPYRLDLEYQKEEEEEEEKRDFQRGCCRREDLKRIITDVLIKSNYNMCSVDFLSKLLLFMTIAQGESKRSKEKRLQIKKKEKETSWDYKD